MEQTLGVIVMLFFLLIAVIILLFLTPGMAVNLLLGRFGRDIAPFLDASFSDQFTWYFSLVFWVATLYWYVLRERKKAGIGVVGNGRPQIHTPRQTSAGVAASGLPVAKKVMTSTVADTASNTRKGAGPFCLWMGMQSSDLGMPRSISGSKYIYPSLPYGDAFFNEYRLSISPKKGLYCIEAIKSGISMHDGGYELVRDFRTILFTCDDLYGAHAEVDAVSPTQNKRFTPVSALWSISQNTSLPVDVISIELSAERSNTDRGQITLTYKLSNFELCRKESLSSTRIDEDDWL